MKRRKLFWTDLITSFYLDVLLIKIKRRYLRLQRTSVHKKVFNDKMSLKIQ